MKNMRIVLFAATLAVSVSAQWLNYPTPGIPRTPDGKPNLSARAPKTADGKPDLTGLWSIDGTGFSFDMLGDQKVEMLPWAEAVYKQRLKTYGQDEPSAKCLPSGPIMGLFGVELIKLMQTPKITTILYESGSYRQIFTDGRPLPKDPSPTWLGYSIGHWDKDSFVVESAGYNDKTWLDFTGHPHSEALRVTSRFRRTDFGHMTLEMTFDDPQTYRKPWTIKMNVNYVPDTELLESICAENERDKPHLIGQVEDEKKSEVKVPSSTLAKYVGNYDLQPFGLLRVASDGQQLTVEMPGGSAKFPTFAQSPTTFQFPAMGGAMEFVADSSGKVTHLLMTTVEGTDRADRKQ